MLNPTTREPMKLQIAHPRLKQRRHISLGGIEEKNE